MLTEWSKLEGVNLSSAHIEFKFHCVYGTLGLEVTNTHGMAIVLSSKLTYLFFFQMGNIPIQKNVGFLFVCLCFVSLVDKSYTLAEPFVVFYRDITISGSPSWFSTFFICFDFLCFMLVLNRALFVSLNFIVSHTFIFTVSHKLLNFNRNYCSSFHDKFLLFSFFWLDRFRPI